MALVTITAGNAAQAANVQQLINLLTGVMTDQAITLENQLKLAPGIAAATPAATAWGSTMVKLGEVVTGSAVTNVSFTSIPGTFRTLEMTILARGDAVGSTFSDIGFQLNNDVTGNYGYQQMFGTGGATSHSWIGGQTSATIARMPAALASQASMWSCSKIFFPGYTSTSAIKSMIGLSTEIEAFSVGNVFALFRGGLWNSTAAVTSIKLLSGLGNFITGSVFTLYGVP